MKCKFCGEKITPFMNFGKMPMANGFLKKQDFKKEFFFKLEVGFCKKDFLFQINNHPHSPHIFNNKYPFYTEKSQHMIDHFKLYFKWIKSNFLKKNSKVIEIGSNDGTFLNYFKKSNVEHLGIEPSSNVAKYSRKKGVKVLNKFFCYKEVKKLRKYKNSTDVICAANVICHIPDINDLIKSVDFLLSDRGVFIFEEPYLGSMFKRTSYDQIYDAHVFIFSIHSVDTMFAQRGFELIDVLPQKTHGGSMRYVLARKNKRKTSKIVAKFLTKEKSLNLNNMKSCIKFKKNCIKSKNYFRKKIIELKEKGKTICGYAASAKSTTMLNFCKINSKYIDYIADTTKEKIGKFSPGTHIPIVSIDHFRKKYPDIALLCSWNHKNEIMKKEKKFVKKGGRWIFHVQ